MFRPSPPRGRRWRRRRRTTSPSQPRHPVMMAIERPAIILPLVAEEPAKLIDLVGPLDQPVPEVMADLVPKVAQECPRYGSCIRSRRVLRIGIVGLGHVDGDHSVQVPGRDGDRPRRAGVEVGKEVERRTACGSPALPVRGSSVQSKLQINRHLAASGRRPGFACAWPAQVGNDPVQPAGPAIRVQVVDRYGPVADVLPTVVQAEPVDRPFLTRREHTPLVPHERLERAHLGSVGKVSERTPATGTVRSFRRRAGHNVRNGKPSSAVSSPPKRIG